MPNYKVKANYKGDDGYHAVGEVVELDEAVATPLVEAGLVEATEEKVAEVETPQPPLSSSDPAGPAQTAAPQPPSQTSAPDGFPLQVQPPTQSQIDQDIASIERPPLEPPQLG